jgi:vacuolar-type H+-ATPase subunit H
VLAEERHVQPHHQIDLLSLVDQLQEEIEAAPRLPLSDRVVVSSDILLDLVDALRNAVPQDVIEAERILEARHRLVEDARDKAEQMLEDAREQSKFMLQEHHIVKAAQMKADRLLNQAQREADQLIAEARQTVQGLFNQFEDEGMRLVAEIRKASVRRAS